MGGGTPGALTEGRRLDWAEVRGRVDLAAVATGLLGPAPGRRGARGRRLWWNCPFHEDRNPSFSVHPSSPMWRCFGCGAHGDAAALVMRLRGMSFPEAMQFLAGVPIVPKRARPSLPRRGMPESEALALVEEAERRLWAREGERALDYLTGPRRLLSPRTIREARLGWTPRAQGVPWRPPGIVIPWIEGSRPALVKVRPPDEWRSAFPKDRRPPKYIEAYRGHDLPPTLYPGLGVIREGRPLILTEGEFDALLLGQELEGVATAATLGSASASFGPDLLNAMLGAPAWFIATDADPAGDKAAAGWPARARRVRPPGPYKDWTEARADGMDLRRWWGDILAGAERPALFTFDELAGWRWGPHAGDPDPSDPLESAP
jgi:hypothetical protein